MKIRCAGAALVALFGWGVAQAGGCDSIAAEPVRYDVVFERDVQPYFGGVDGATEPAFCANCHVSLERGGLSLAPDRVRLELLGSDETGEDAQNFFPEKRIVPGRPFDSIVFVRAHCDTSPPGRMPPQGVLPELQKQFVRFQAVLHDWIALGAIMADTDRRFVGDFETLR